MPQFRVIILAIVCAVTGCCGFPSYQYGAASGGCSGPCGCGPTGCGSASSGCHGCAGGGHPALALHHHFAPHVPPGEQVPMPKFHPVPTRPVFEPQLTYLPPQPHPTLSERYSTLPAAEPEPTPAVRR